MNSLNSETHSNRMVRTGLGWHIPLMLPPLLILLLLVVWAGVEYRSRQLIESRIQTRQSAGKPINYAEMTQAIFDRSKIDGTIAFTSLVRQANSMRSQMKPPDVFPVEQFFNAPDAADPEAFERVISTVEGYLENAQSVFEKIDELAKMPQPIWVPQVSESHYYSSTMYSLSHLVQIDIVVATRKQDRSRIFSGFERLLILEDLSPGVEFGGNYWSTYGRLKARLILLTKCLAAIDWTAEELTQLQKFASEIPDLTERWRNNMENWVVGGLASDPDDIWRYGRDERQLLERLLRPTISSQVDRLQFYEQVAKVSFAEPRLAAAELASYAVSNPSPQDSRIVEYTPNQLVEIESLGKLVNCGIAIRRFKLLHQRWPKDLRELTGPWLSVNDLQLHNQQMVGFSVDESGPEIWLPTEATKFGRLKPAATTSTETTWRLFVTRIRDQDVLNDSPASEEEVDAVKN